MPKTIPAALQAHYDTGRTCLSAAVLIQRADGELFGFTMNSKPLTLDITPWDDLPWVLTGETAFEFEAASGMEAFVIESTAGFEVDETQIVSLNNGGLFTENDVLAGRWEEDIAVIRRPSSPGVIAMNLCQTAVSAAQADKMMADLQAAGPRVARVAFIGLDRAGLRNMKDAGRRHGVTFVHRYFDDFVLAKDWLIPPKR